MSASFPSLPPATSAASEFQQAQELLNGFLNSQASLTSQNVREIGQKCLTDIGKSFCEKTFLQYPNEINQIFRGAMEKIQSVVNQVTRAVRKRPLEEASSSVEAKRPKFSVSSEVYNGFLYLFGDEEKTKSFCDRLSRTAIDFLEHVGRAQQSSAEIPIHMHYAECYKRLFLPIALDVFAINEELVNDYAELAVHLSLREETRNNLVFLINKLMSLKFFPLIKELYPDEPPYEAMRRILNLGDARNSPCWWSQIFFFYPFQWENPIYPLCLAGGSKQRLASLDSLPFDLSRCSPEVNKLFASLSDDKLSAISSMFSVFSQLSLTRNLFASSEEILRTVQRCLEDSRLFDYFTLANQECNPLSDDGMAAIVSWFFRNGDQEFVPPTCPLCTKFPWTREEVLTIINAYGEWASPLRFWDAEMTGRIEEELSCTTLCAAPREVLLRFLGSKPFPIVKAWLETFIETPTGRQARVLTLSAAQREDILRRFRGDDDFFLSSPGWRELLHATEEESRELCGREEPPAISTAEHYHRSIVAALDPHDPVSLIRLLGEGHDMRALVAGLMNARVESICNQRTFLTWGNAEAGIAACVAQDAPPLCVKDGDTVFPIYPGDAFSELSFGVAAVSLRRRLIAFEQLNFEEFCRIIQDRPQRDFRTPEGIELLMELRRLQDRFRAKFFPSSMSEDSEEPIQMAFRERLKQLYREECEQSGLTVDPDTALYKNSILFLSLFRLAREAKVLQKTKGAIVEFGYGISFYIQSLRDTARPRLEDNPGVVHFQEWASRYSRGSITPITPPNASPGGFLRLISAIQSLTDKQYNSVRTAGLKLAASHVDEYLQTEKYFEEWEKRVQEEAPGLFIDAAWAIIPVTKNYLPSMSCASHKDEPSGTYQVTDDPNEFCPEVEVPLWLPYSNFSGAICASFIPHNPERHDGNCGVNSFLLGLHGSTAYEGDHPRNLSEDIVHFRQEIVSYAREHEGELKEEFGKKAVDEIITRYARIPVWTGAEVWSIAARVYGREIRLISEETHMGIFRRENSTIVPFDENDVFLPKGEPKEPPIYLVFFGQAHYANLEPKAAPGHV